MSEASASVRIVIAESAERLEGPSEDRIATLDALRRLGSEVRLEVAHDAAGCLALARDGGADLVVVDRELGADAERILAELRGGGPPVVVVTRSVSADAALDAFRRGASDCVTASADYAEVLPAVALEQIRVWRRERARQEARERIRVLERLSAAIVRQFPAALAVLDREGRVVTLNPEFVRAFDLAGRAVDGQLLSGVLPSDLLESGELEELRRRTAAGETSPPRIARGRRGAFEGRVFDVRAERLDEAGRTLLVLLDITDREALTRRVRTLQQYTENIIQNMNSALLVVDTAGRVTAGNPTAGEILGEPSDALRGRLVWSWFPTTPREEVLIARTLREGRRFRGAETVLTRADGRRVPIGISCAPLRDDAGTKLGAVAIFQDLSEIKQLQRQVLQTEKMASIGQLAAGIAHEINNPMGFIHANLFQMEEYLADLRRLWDGARQLLETARTGPDDALRKGVEPLATLARELDADYLLADFAKAVRESEEGSERIRHIVQDLRVFSHQDTGERELADVNQSLDSTAHIVSTMTKHGVRLRKEYAKLPRIRGYPMQLKQVFMNLLVNAYQAIEERARRDGLEGGEIVLTTRRAAGGIVVSVADDGVGIPAENADRIFDPFFTTKEVGVGTGLGLSTAFNIVRRHGGTIRVDSQIGRGTTFEVFLPLGAESTESESESGESSPA